MPLKRGLLWALDYAFGKIHSNPIFRPVGATGKLWTGGWGDPYVFERLQNLHRVRQAERGSRYGAGNGLVDAPKIEWAKPVKLSTGGHLIEGSFLSPVAGDGTLPRCSEMAQFNLLTPPQLAVEHGKMEESIGNDVPVWVWLAGTGEQGMGTRRYASMPLVSEGYAVLILESPYYGKRRPPWQKGSKLRCVSDLLSLGNASIEETLALLEWLRRAGFGPAGVCGFSMGGVHAMMTASVSPHPLALVPLLAPRCASHVFTEGALSHAVDWAALSTPNKGMLRGDGSSGRGYTTGEESGMGEGGGGMAWGGVENGVAEAYAKYAEHTIGGWEGVWGVSPTGGAGSREEAIRRLRHVLKITDVAKLMPPISLSSTILVQADQDAYIASTSASEVCDAWGECEVRVVPGGHVSAFISQHEAFRTAMRDSMARMRRDETAKSRATVENGAEGAAAHVPPSRANGSKGLS